MTKEELDWIYDKVDPVYTSLEQVPSRWLPETSELLENGVIKGDGVHEIFIRDSALVGTILGIRGARTLLVQKDRGPESVRSKAPLL